VLGKISITRSPSSSDTGDIGGCLVKWFQENQRPLPWRRDYSPYAVWISEVMLQQTQVGKVVPYFERWMEHFPNPDSLAVAKEEELLLLWEGLGYYSRVRNLQKAAKKIVLDYEGRIPQNEKELRRLPGIGPYTAAAILSLAFQQDIPVVDGNVERVVARMVDLDQSVKTPSSQKTIKETLTHWLPKGHARDFNQAIMELGATVCTPALPACDTCPVSHGCHALRNGTVKLRPVQTRRPEVVPLISSVGILCDDDRFFIQKRPPGGLMANLWEFPNGTLQGREFPEEALHRTFLESLGVKVTISGKLGKVRHAYTRYRVQLHVYRCSLDPPGQVMKFRGAVEGRWVTKSELENHAFSSAHRRIIEGL
jgi:A/G-specific adenine glycosylase